MPESDASCRRRRGIFKKLLESNCVNSAGPGFKNPGPVSVSDGTPSSGAGADEGIVEYVVLPEDVHCKISDGFNSFQMSCVPGSRQCRQEIDAVVLTLYEHLCHPCHPAEVSVNLERRMAVPEIVVGSLAQKIAVEFVGPVTVPEPCPKVEFPSH